jgi:hypothetical protein
MSRVGEAPRLYDPGLGNRRARQRAAGSFVPKPVIWPVWIDDWQYMSAGPRFAVGDSVEWALLLEDGSAHAVPRDRLVTATLTISNREVMTPAREWPAPAYERMTVQAGGMRADYRAPAYHAPAKTSDTFKFSGLLYEDHHGGSSQTSRGVVRDIEIVTRRFRYAEGARPRTVVTDWQTRHVEQSPRRLEHDMEAVGPEFSVGGSPGWRSARPIAQEDLLVSVEYPDH